jgi:hypothetical protein
MSGNLLIPMLDKQRDKGRPIVERRNFARNFVLVHLVAGLIVPGLLVFHELFTASLTFLLWYLLTFGLVVGMTRRQEWCRPLLGVMFLMVAVASAFFVTRVHPTLTLDHSPLLSRDFLPLWGVLVTVGYAYGGLMMLVSNRLRRATTLGFALW